MRRFTCLLLGLLLAALTGAAGVFFQLLCAAQTLEQDYAAARERTAVLTQPTDTLFSLSSGDEERMGYLRPQQFRDILLEAGAEETAFRAVVPAVSYNLTPVRTEYLPSPSGDRQFLISSFGEPSFRLVFYDDPGRIDDFLCGGRRIVRGSLPRPDSTGECAISEELAEKNGLQVGSTISFLHYSGWNVPFYFRVAGIYRDSTAPYLPSRYFSDFNQRRNEVVSTVAALDAEYTAALTYQPLDRAIPIAYEAVGVFPGPAPVARLSQLMEAGNLPNAALAEEGPTHNGGLAAPAEVLLQASLPILILAAVLVLTLALPLSALLWPRQRRALLARHCLGEAYSSRPCAHSVLAAYGCIAVPAFLLAPAALGLWSASLQDMLGGSAATLGSALPAALLPYTAPMAQWPSYAALPPYWVGGTVLLLAAGGCLCLTASCLRARRFYQNGLFDYMTHGGGNGPC